MDYSKFGSEVLGNGLRVYHQGGLDTYCGFYASFNLINFLKHKSNRRDADFVGAKDFKAFKSSIAGGNLRGLFPETPFGDEGMEAPLLSNALSRLLRQFGIRGTTNIEEDPYRDPSEAENQLSWFRPGSERPFLQPTLANAALGLGVVMEDERDLLGHWVVFVGKDHLEGRNLKYADRWNGIILDSQRGYERWRVEMDGEWPRMVIGRGDLEIPIEWLCSFISVNVTDA